VTLTCNLNEVPAGWSAYLGVNSTATLEGLFDVSVSTTADNDPNASNNVAVQPLEVWPRGAADLQVSGYQSSSSLAVGTTARFSYQLQNAGPFVATDVQFDVVLPENVSVESVIPSSSGDAVECSTDGGTITCTTPSINQWWSIWIYVDVVAVSPGIGIAATGSASSSSADLRSGNDTLALLFDVLAAPDAPEAPTVSPLNGGALVSWVAPFDGGSQIATFVIEGSDGGSTWSQLATVSGDATSAMIAGLVSGRSYSFRVAAVNAVGQGAFSHSSVLVTLGSPPRAPTGLYGRAGDRSVWLDWTAPRQGGRAVVTDYVIEYSSNRGLTWRVFNDGVSAGSEVVVTGLRNRTTYVFRVAAINAFGAGRYSAPSARLTPRSPRGRW
jgi:hypothetical protein